MYNRMKVAGIQSQFMIRETTFQASGRMAVSIVNKIRQRPCTMLIIANLITTKYLNFNVI